MSAFAVYILKSSMLLALLVSLFVILMSRETFHKANRFLLLFIVLLSLGLPLTNIGYDTPFSSLFSKVEGAFTAKEYTVAVENDALSPEPEPVPSMPGTVSPVVEFGELYADVESLPSAVIEEMPVAEPAAKYIVVREDIPLWARALAICYIAGIVVLLLRQAVVYFQVIGIIIKGRRAESAIYGVPALNLRIHTGKDKPFSWFSWVVVSEEDLSDGAREILVHESAHINAGHSWDILLADIVTVMQWFNPLAWIMKNSLKDIHEFEADEAVIESGVNAKINSCFVIPDRTSKPYKGLQKGRTWAIHNTDMHTICQAAEHAEEVAPMCFGGQSTVRYGNWHDDYSIVGVTSAYPKILYVPLLYGREINDIDVAEKRKVCVIGNEVYCKLFPEGGNPVGKLLHIGSMQFRIVGVKAKSKAQVNIGGHPDQQLLWPISTLQQAYHLGENIHLIMATAQPDVAVSMVEEELKTIIKELYSIAPDDNRAIYTQNMEEMLKAFKYLVMGLSALIWLIGLGTLISGAVGVSNIMLVTVRERTKEIGIRRAIGASPWVITKQILAESTLLTLLAGLLGIVAAVGVLQVAQQLLQSNEMFSQEMQISFGIAIGGLVILLVIGLLAGLLPARRALAIKPIEALNEE